MMAGKSCYMSIPEWHRAKEAKPVYPHYCPQNGTQIWWSRADKANLDPYSEVEDKPRYRVILK